MHIGMTYDLRSDYLAEGLSEEETAEFDRPDTIEAIDTALRDLGHSTDRIGNIKSLTGRLANGERWDIVFNIAEGLHGLSREAQVPALLEAYEIPYVFSDPLVLSITMHKGIAKQLVKSHGLATPDFAVVNSPEDLQDITLPFPLFAKPLAEGTGKGVTAASIIHNRDQLLTVGRDLLHTYKQPVLIETYLSGREFTVGIVGTDKTARSIGIVEVILLHDADPGVYSYRNKEICEEVVEYRLVDDEEAKESERLALECWKALGCRDAGRVDLRSNGNAIPHFIEVNPLAGLHPEHSDLCIIATKMNMPYLQLIESIVAEAELRIQAGKKNNA